MAALLECEKAVHWAAWKVASLVAYLVDEKGGLWAGARVGMWGIVWAG